MLHFNTETMDFWPMYESIKQFYPLGFKRDDPWKMFYAYPGMYRLGKIKAENINDEGKFSRWAEFTEEIAAISQKQVIDRTIVDKPCFNSCIVPETITSHSITREKQLQFFVI